MGTFSEKLIDYTAKNSHFETSRNYVSLSHCILPEDELIKQFFHGFDDSVETRLRCYKGYQMEADIMNRIKAVFGSKIETGIEISAFDGLVKGHPDFSYKGFPADCKSVLMNDWLPKDKLPSKVYWQMQGYMLYSNTDKALVVYESKEGGLIQDFWIDRNERMQRNIDEKMRNIIPVIKSKLNTV